VKAIVIEVVVIGPPGAEDGPLGGVDVGEDLFHATGVGRRSEGIRILQIEACLVAVEATGF